MKQHPLLAHTWLLNILEGGVSVCEQLGRCEGLGEIEEGSLAESNPLTASQASLSVVRGFRQPAH